MKVTVLIKFLTISTAGALTTELISQDGDGTPPKVDANSPFAKCHDAGKTWEECQSLPTTIKGRDLASSPNISQLFAREHRGSSPFSDCLNGGGSWDTCHGAVTSEGQRQNSLQTRADRGSSPFTDCLNGGGSWAKCQSSVHSQKRAVPAAALELKRDLSTTSNDEIQGTTTTLVESSLMVRETAPNFKGQAACYATPLSKWITNTAVDKVKKEACQKTISGLKAVGYQAFGKKYGLVKAGVGAFYYNKAGSYWPVAGNLELKGYRYKIPTNAAAELDGKAQELCEQAILAFAGDKNAGGKDCTTDEKSVWTFGKVGHHAVNGGFYHVTFDGKGVQMDDEGSCTNCALSFNLEWPEKLSKEDK